MNASRVGQSLRANQSNPIQYKACNFWWENCCLIIVVSRGDIATHRFGSVSQRCYRREFGKPCNECGEVLQHIFFASFLVDMDGEFINIYA